MAGTRALTRDFLSVSSFMITSKQPNLSTMDHGITQNRQVYLMKTPGKKHYLFNYFLNFGLEYKPLINHAIIFFRSSIFSLTNNKNFFH